MGGNHKNVHAAFIALGGMLGVEDGSHHGGGGGGGVKRRQEAVEGEEQIGGWQFAVIVFVAIVAVVAVVVNIIL